MKSALITLALLAPLAVLGCRSPDPSLALVESEARYLENQLLDLEYLYEQKCDELESCRLENDALRNEIEQAGSGRGYMPTPRSGPQPRVDIDLGASLPLDAAGDDGEAPEDLRVERIVLNGRLTGGYDFDGLPGDEGISVLIEPQNAAHQYVPIGGEISVVVLDPAKEDAAARVARWDLDREQTAKLIQRSVMGRGIHLELPWPNEPPANPDLQVFVRYTTADERDLEGQRDIRVDLASSISSRWTPAGRRGVADARPAEVPHVADVRGDVTAPSAARPTAPSAQPSPSDATSPPVIGESGPGFHIDVPLPGGTGPSGDPAGAGSEPSRERRPFWRPFR